MGKTLRFLLCGTACVCSAGTAWGQDGGAARQPEPASPASVDSDIVVTARRQSETILDVPLAVSVVGAQQLQNNLATDLTKISELAPQVIIGRQTVGTGAVIGIRGISSTSTDPGLDQSVAVAIDGVVLSRGRIVSAATFDLAQVEVLSGPQALFFGKNSPGGVIALASADPTDQFEAYLRAGYEFEARERYAEGAISGPLSSTLQARFAFRASNIEGWMRNVAQPTPDPLHPGVTVPGAVHGDRLPEGESYAGRLTLQWEPSDAFQAELKILGSSERLNSSTGYAEPFCTNTTGIPVGTLNTPLPGADCRRDRIKSEAGLPAVYAVNFPNGNGGVPFFDSEAWLGSLTMSFNLSDNLTLSSTTGYYSQNITDSRNGDFSPLSLIWASQEEQYELITQEIRLTSDFDGPINFMLGAYYESSDRFFGNYPDLFHGGIGLSPPAGLNVAAGNYTTVETTSDTSTETYSFFGQLRWNILENLELAAGARYSRDDKDHAQVNDTVGVSTLPLRPAGSVLRSTFSDDNISPEITLSWRPGDRQLVYAGYRTGYKSGALSTPALLLSTATPDTIRIGSEEATGWEIGYRGFLFDNRLRFDIAAYVYDFDGLQLGTFDPRTVSFNVQNAASARTEGVQGSFSFRATDAFTINGNIGWNRARYRDFRNAQCFPGQTVAQGCVSARQDLTGASLVRAPELTFSVGGNYRADLGNNWVADFSADASYSSDYQTAPDNAPAGIQEEFVRLNAAIHLNPGTDRFRLSVIGRNLTNEYYLVSTSGRPAAGPNEWIGVFNRPREVVVQAEIRF